MDIKKAIGRALVPAFLLASVSGVFANDPPNNIKPRFISHDVLVSTVRNEGYTPVLAANFHEGTRKDGTLISSPLLLLKNESKKSIALVSNLGNGMYELTDAKAEFIDHTNRYGSVEVNLSMNFKSCSNIPQKTKDSFETIFTVFGEHGIKTEYTVPKTTTANGTMLAITSMQGQPVCIVQKASSLHVVKSQLLKEKEQHVIKNTLL